MSLKQAAMEARAASAAIEKSMRKWDEDPDGKNAPER